MIDMAKQIWGLAVNEALYTTLLEEATRPRQMFDFGMRLMIRSMYQRNLFTLHFTDGTQCQIMKAFGTWRPLFQKVSNGTSK